MCAVILNVVLEPGSTLAGKYQVERVLGRGGMGCVVSAIHQQLGQRVAIKVLLPEAVQIQEAVERFLREARAAVRLRSEHVGRVIDVGQLDDGTPYLVMEFLEGIDLLGYLDGGGALTVMQAADFVLQACEAIGEAHALGIVHRDLKPANLFVTRRADGTHLIKVLDFGISKAQDSSVNFSLTTTTSILGSPGYMSPEQLRSARTCDARTDIWALGAILYELTTDRQPFTADTITELALKVAMDPAPPMHILGGPPGFEQVVFHCLEKDPAARYQNAAELAYALAPFGSPGAMEAAMRVARVLHLTAPRPRSPSEGLPFTPIERRPTTLSSAVSSIGAHQSASAPPPKRRAGVIAGLVVGAAVAALAIAVATTGSGKPATPTTTQPTPTPPPPAPIIEAPTPPERIVEPAIAVDAGVAAVDAGAPAGPTATKPTTKPKPAPPRPAPRKPAPPDDDDLSNSRY